MDRVTLSSRLKDKKGTVTVSVAVLLIFLIMFAAFAIDVGYMMVRRNELQNIADTAALAATGELGNAYSTMNYIDSLAYTPTQTERQGLLDEARAVAANTGVSGVTIESSDLILGVWSPSTHTLIPATTRPTAVNVTAHKDGTTTNVPFSTLLAGVLGIDTFKVSATATASLTPLWTANPGTLPIPVGISYEWYKKDWGEAGYCNQPIKFYPTSDTGCAGWHVYDQSPASARTLRDTIGGLTNGTYTSPATTAGVTTYDFTGGNVANQFSNDHFTTLSTLFNANKVSDTDGRCQASLAEWAPTHPYQGYSWTAAVAVYAPVEPTIAQSLDAADCSNPHGNMLIVGFSTITLCAVDGPPTYSDKLIYAIVDCDAMSSGPGGGPIDTGTSGTYPNLVQ
jgi:Flp pilus assembly protein TadG